MSIPGLTLIGESLNDSVPGTHKLYEAGDLEGLKALARTQDEEGADYLDLNVGVRPPAFLAEMVRQVQDVTAKPLSIDTPDPAMAEAALRAYDPRRAGGQRPILNSISPLRTEMFELCHLQPFTPILLVSERMEGGKVEPNRTAAEVHRTAQELVQMARGRGIGLGQCILDPAISPIGADTEGDFKRLVGALQLIHADPTLRGVHVSVGMSNFTVMLPPKRADGSPTKGPLECAFLTLAMPLGLDHVIGSVKRRYALLPAEHPAMRCLDDCLRLEGFEVVRRVQQYYSA